MLKAAEGNLLSNGNTKFGQGNDANKLTVDEGETATKLKITATYTDNGKEYKGDTTISVTEKTQGGA